MAKPVLAIFTSAEGHLSIAEAIRQVFEEKYEVISFIERHEIFNYYVPFYQFFPGIFTLPFKVAKKQQFARLVHQFFKEKYLTKIQRFFGQHRPVCVINTYFMYNAALETVAHTARVPFINILTDPRTLYAFIIAEQAQANIIFDEEQEKYCQQFDLSAKYQAMGWFVRNQFEQPYDKTAVRQKLNLPNNLPIFLVTSGSEGSTMISKIFPTLIGSAHPAQIIVACGNNKSLYKSMKVFGQMLKKTKSKIQVIPLGFTTNIHEYMQAADLVIGKAGPNTLFESVATLTPFFAITHIPGQEDGNLDIIRDYNVGYVEESAFKAARLLKNLIRHPTELEKFQPYLKKLADYNHNAKAKLFDLVEASVSQT